MVHGGPDYGIYAPKTTIISIEDLGELAVRLGSIVNFDRKGDVLWLDDFEDDITKWESELTGDRGSVLWSPNHPQSKGFSLKATTGDTNEDEVLLSKWFASPVLSRIGCEYHFISHNKLGYIIFANQIMPGVGRKWGSVKYTRATQTWQYYDVTLGWTDLSPTMELEEGEYTYNAVKLVLDFVTNYYVSLIVNKTTYDLSSYPLKPQAWLYEPGLRPTITIRNNSAAAAIVYFDSVVITQNEP